LRQKRALRIAIQGEPGSNSHAATTALLGQQELVACAQSAQVFDALDSGRADAAVLPIENSLHGSVAEHYDLLLRHSVAVIAELTLRIQHSLIAAPGTTMESVRRVFSHPVALSQCRGFFSAHTEIEAVSFYDTAGAVKYLLAENLLGSAAIAREDSAAIYGGVVLARGLEDDPQNFTRFFLLAPQAASESLRPEKATGQKIDKMSLAFAVEHRPGSLVPVLQSLAALGVDLTRIESRPVPGRPWEYIFYLDLRIQQEKLADAVLSTLRGQCTMVRELGRYLAG